MDGIMPPLCNVAMTREAKNSRLRLAFSDLLKIATHEAVADAGSFGSSLLALDRRADRNRAVMQSCVP